MKAILTKYLSPTATKGSRIKAYDSDGNTHTTGFHESIGNGLNMSIAEKHLRAAYELCAKMNWNGFLAQGSVGNGFAHVFVEDAADAREAARKIGALLAEDALWQNQHGTAQSTFILKARKIAAHHEQLHSTEGL